MYFLFLETVTTPDKEYIYQHPIKVSEQSDENCIPCTPFSKTLLLEKRI